MLALVDTALGEPTFAHLSDRRFLSANHASPLPCLQYRFATGNLTFSGHYRRALSLRCSIPPLVRTSAITQNQQDTIQNP
jgi:hypothetical protein